MISRTVFALVAVAAVPAVAVMTPAEAVTKTNIITVTSSNHAKVLARSAKKPLVLKFGATWCGPCQAMEPVIKRMNTKDGNKWTLGLVDVDAEEDLFNQYGGGSIPHVFCIRNKQRKSDQIGYDNESTLRRWVNSCVR